MKRKLIMTGMAVMTGLRHAVCAKGPGKDVGTLRQGSWDTPFSISQGTLIYLSSGRNPRPKNPIA